MMLRLHMPHAVAGPAAHTILAMLTASRATEVRVLTAITCSDPEADPSATHSGEWRLLCACMCVFIMAHCTPRHSC